MSAARRQVAANLWTKPIGLNHKPACRLPVNYRIPKDIETYQKLPKTGLKIEYRPSVSGVVVNLEMGERLGSGAKPQRGPGLVEGQG